MTLLDILTSASIGLKHGIVSRVKLQRNGKEYLMNLREIFSEKAPEIRIVDGDHIFVEDRSAEIIKTTSIVDDNGYIILSDVGKIKAAGLTLNELRSKIALLIEKSPNSRNEFQINITDFLSQSCILSIPAKRQV